MQKKAILITGASGFLGKYVVNAIKCSGQPADTVTLGINPADDMQTDLTKGSPYIDRRFDIVVHCAGGCFKGDMTALNVGITRNLLDGLDRIPPSAMVYISSVEVYGRHEGSDLDECTITDPDTPAGLSKLRAEEMLANWCGQRGITLSILRCPPIVGTGMTGPLRKLVNAIYRGSYYHIIGNEARTSVIHAVDVAKAAIDIARHGGIYNLTDGVNPTRRDLADALSFRMGNKRIFNLSPAKARRWAKINDWLPLASFGSKDFIRETTTLTFRSDKIFNVLDWRPNPVTEYLKCHDYEKDSI